MSRIDGKLVVCESPDAAIAAVQGRLESVGTEEISWSNAAGRVLAERVVADRDSPPCDVSAKDGYAVRLADLSRDALPVVATILAGRPPCELPAGTAVRIMTGAATPAGTQAVLRREDTQELSDSIRLRIGASAVRPDENIRRQGENVRLGAEVAPIGTLVNAAVMASLAMFGVLKPRVYRRLRVGIVTTGDELLDSGTQPSPWQIRDSNGPSLHALTAACPWIQTAEPVRGMDSPDHLRQVLTDSLSCNDVLFISGGVSMGDRDYVPQVLESLGASTVFHRLPVRPGHPILGAIGPQGQVIVGLPGNPVSALVCACRIGSPICRFRAGLRGLPAGMMVSIVNPEQTQLNAWWWRIVRITGAGQARLLSSQSSGDLVSAARGDGFVEIPPQTCSHGLVPFFPWAI